MAMVKVIPSGSQVFDEPVAQIIKKSSAGLRGNDLQAFVKRAGHGLADSLHKIKINPGEVPVHLIAIGSTEYYGPNRNGDGFKEAVCRKYHDTFVKNAHFYRNHVNKDPKKSYGLVKLSDYNDKMHRIELIAVLNETKAAADRNGGLLATPILEKMASGDVGVSMACRVPFDVCSVCGNAAKNRSEYCKGTDEGGNCSGGGLLNKIATVLEDGTQLFADNPDPVFFDISEVPRPADRIAYTTGIMKAASYVKMGGAALAESMGITMPIQFMFDTNNIKLNDTITTIQKLANIEKRIRSEIRNNVNYCFAVEAEHKIASANDDHLSSKNILAALVREKIAMPVDVFCNMGFAPEIFSTSNSVNSYLPDIYSKILEKGNFEKLSQIVENFDVSETTPPVNICKWAEKFAMDYSFDEELVRKRCLRGSLQSDSGPPVLRRSPLISINGPAYDTAEKYAMYKVAFIINVKKYCKNSKEYDNICELAVRQNYL